MDIISRLLKEMISYYSGDVRRICHFIKVHEFAKMIGQIEGLDSMKLNILEIAAIVHDIGIKSSEQKYNSSAGKYQQIEGPPIARDLMNKFEIEKHVVDRVCFLVANHHNYNVIDDIDLQILVEADFLVNIDEDSMDNASIKSIKDKYFKTTCGFELMNKIFIC